MADSRHSTRRAFLKTAPLAAVAVATPAMAVAISETPMEKVNRLGWELAHALNDYSDGNMHAEIYPSAKTQFAVGFKYDLLETQEEKVRRIARMLQFEMSKLPSTNGETFDLDYDGGALNTPRMRLGLKSGKEDTLIGFLPPLSARSA